MSPLSTRPLMPSMSFPRTRGDEPTRYDAYAVALEFSPHARG